MEQQDKNIVAAIDVGTTKVVVLVGRKGEDGAIEIIGYGRTESKGVRRGAVLNIELTIDAIKTAVAKAEETSGYKITEAYIGIAGQHIRSQRFTQTLNRNSQSEPISEGDIQDLINQMRDVPTEMGEEVLHILPQSYKVDNENEITNPIGISGKQISGDYHIVFGQTAAANNLRRCVEKNGITVKRLILEPLASATAVLTPDDKELGVALVDIGGGTTDLAIFKDSRIFHTEVIPVGGNIITSDIKEGCGILERLAENLKVQYGAAIPTPDMVNKAVSIPGSSGLKSKEISLTTLANIINARVDEIIATIKFHLDASGANKKLGGGIVITGGGAMLRHLVQLFAARTGYEIRIGIPNQRIISKIESVTTLPSNSTSIGLLKMAFDNSLIDGMNVEFIKQDAEKPKVDEKSASEDTFFDDIKETGKTEKKGSNLEKIQKKVGSVLSWFTDDVDDEY